MAANEPVQIVYNRFWGLLALWPGFTSLVTVANWVNFNDPSKPLADWMRRIGRAPSDVPSLAIDVDTFDDNPNVVKTLGNLNDPTCPRIMQVKATYLFTIQGFNRIIGKVLQVQAEIRACLEAGGQDLGLTGVVRWWGPITTETNALRAAPLVPVPTNPGLDAPRRLVMRIPVVISRTS